MLNALMIISCAAMLVACQQPASEPPTQSHRIELAIASDVVREQFHNCIAAEMVGISIGESREVRVSIDYNNVIDILLKENSKTIVYITNPFDENIYRVSGYSNSEYIIDQVLLRISYCLEQSDLIIVE